MFNTYHKTYAPATQPNYVETSLPQAPAPVTPDRPVAEQRKFLAPLKIKLRGVVALDDQSLNRIIIADEQTQDQKSYKVGEIVEDGLLIKIFPNKAVFLRSNGQQETLYLNEKDIEQDALISQQKKYWTNIIHHVKDNHFVLDHQALVKCIHNVGVLFDLFNITTLYENGLAKGLRVGTLPSHSLGNHLGLETHDVITHALDISLTSLSDQKKCYELFLTKKFGDTVSLRVERNGHPITLSYTLEDLKDPFDTSIEGTKTKVSGAHMAQDQDLQNERIKLLKKKYKFAPTAQELKIQQKLISVKKNSQATATI